MRRVRSTLPTITGLSVRHCVYILTKDTKFNLFFLYRYFYYLLLNNEKRLDFLFIGRKFTILAMYLHRFIRIYRGRGWKTLYVSK